MIYDRVPVDMSDEDKKKLEQKILRNLKNNLIWITQNLQRPYDIRLQPKIEKSFVAACGRIYAVDIIKGERGHSEMNVSTGWTDFWNDIRNQAIGKGYKIKSFTDYSKSIEKQVQQRKKNDGK